jgi:hypothetical protein
MTLHWHNALCPGVVYGGFDVEGVVFQTISHVICRRARPQEASITPIGRLQHDLIHVLQQPH